MLKTIHIFRHGLTDWNQIQRLQGHSDIPLNQEGRNQALSLQEYFAKNPVDLFVSSDLQRAAETAKIANEQLNRPHITSSLFREVYLGDLEGCYQADIPKKFGEEAWNQWISIEPEHQHFSFPHAESSFQAVLRLHSALTEFCENHEFQVLGLCSHGFLMKRFLHSLAPELKFPLLTPNCSVFKVTWHTQTKQFSFAPP